MEEKYYGQQCQDEETNNSFRQLHHDIVNMIISWCKEHNVIADEFSLNADGLPESIACGKWVGATDSFFCLQKFTQDYKDVVDLKRVVSKEEFEDIKFKQKPYIYSA